MSKEVRLNSKRSFMMKIPNKRELQQVAFNHSSELTLWRFYEDLQKMCCKIFLANDTTLPSHNLLGFRKNILK